MRYVCSVALLCGVTFLWSATADAQFAPPKKASKNFYVVRDARSGECSVKIGKFGNSPEGAVGDAPYASKAYAVAAMEKFPECKGTKRGKAEKARKD